MLSGLSYHIYRGLGTKTAQATNSLVEGERQIESWCTEDQLSTMSTIARP